MSERRGDLLRERHPEATQVMPVELFFDLVYVLAVTQLTHHLRDHLSPRGAAETLLLLLAVWGAWIHTTWLTNYFDRGTRPVRLALIGVMLASLIMSAALPDAFAARGLAFAAALAAILVGGTLGALLAVGPRHHLGPVFARVLVWWSAIAVLWLAGGAVNGGARTAVWLVAVALTYVVMWIGFPVPGFGHSSTTDYTIDGSHMAERCRLFVILALGESILLTGTTFGDDPVTLPATAAFVVAFIGSATLWWLYFDRAEAAARRLIAAATDPARLALSAYTYGHIPLVAGIVVAAAAEMTIAHPIDPAPTATTALILGGPALYLAGNLLFKRVVWGRLPRSRLVALCALAALVPVAPVAPALALLIAATLVPVALGVGDTFAGHSGTTTGPERDAAVAPASPSTRPAAVARPKR